MGKTDALQLLQHRSSAHQQDRLAEAPFYFMLCSHNRQLKQEVNSSQAVGARTEQSLLYEAAGHNRALLLGCRSCWRQVSQSSWEHGLLGPREVFAGTSLYLDTYFNLIFTGQEQKSSSSRWCSL